MSRDPGLSLGLSLPALNQRGATIGSPPPGLGPDDTEGLRVARVERFLTDPDPPFTISAERFRFDDKRRIRALADIDGLVAGVNFLVKVQKGHSNDDGFSQLGELSQSSGIDPLLDDLSDISNSSSPHDLGTDFPAYVNLHELLNDRPDVAKALIGAKSLLRGMEAELRRFNDVAYKSTSIAIISIRSRFTSAEALAECGALVYRDAIYGFCPGTLDEIFALASFSHVTSRILVRQDRMGESHETQVLSGVRQLRNCIDNEAEKSIFDTLVSHMWPAIPLPESHDEAPRLPLGVAASTATDMDRFFGDALDSNTGILPINLEEGALNLTERAGRKFNFAVLRGFHGGHTYTPPNSIDPRELSKFCPAGQPIPKYNSSLFHAPPLRSPTATQPSLGSQTPLPPSVPTGPPFGGQSVYQFRTTDEVFDCKALNLRNTILFLAIVAFASDAGDGFYLLSGSGKTAGRSGTGSARASERFKTVKKLQEDLFDPLKKSGTDDAGFLALLAVAKKFVVLGWLRTKDEVQDYLITISKELLTGGDRQPKFVRWIFGQLPSSAAARDSKSTHQSKPRPQNKRRNSPGRQLGEDGPTKRQRVHCKHPGCTFYCYTPSGLTKHKIRIHVPVTEVFSCPSSGCEYSSPRRDLAREHYHRKHGKSLPPSLKETRPGYRGGEAGGDEPF